MVNPPSNTSVEGEHGVVEIQEIRSLLQLGAEFGELPLCELDQ
jgi:hypothetical protein